MSTDSFPLFGAMRWSSSELAEALVLTPQRVTQLSKANILPPAADGLYSPIAAVSSYIRFLRQRETGRSQADEITRKLQLENQMREIRLKKISGELVPVSRVKNDWFDAGRRVRDALLGLPPRLSGVFAAESDQHKIYNSLNLALHEILMELATPPQPAAITPEDKQTGEPIPPRVTGEERETAARWLDEVLSQDIDVQGENLDSNAEPPDDRFNEGD